MLVMTLMVRDEADIIAATVEHHLDQGVDRIIVTDNGSTDGTSEILADYAQVAPITIVRDESRDYRQNDIVTRMARRAATEFGADWVINGDADEFVVPLDRSLRLADVFTRLDPTIGSFRVPVINMVGRPARRGTGFGRLVLRDERSEEALVATGVHAHPTPNAIHVGAPDVDVAFGNHFVSIEQHSEVPDGLRLEVLHYPWRSWTQLETKTVNMGLAFEQNADVRPSPKHHIMRDMRRWRIGILEPFYLRRLPDITGSLEGFREDDWFATHMRELANRAHVRERLAAVLDDTHDEPYSDDEIRALRTRSDELLELDERFNGVAEAILQDVVDLHRRTLELSHEVVEYAAEQQRLREQVSDLERHRAALEEARTVLDAQVVQLRGENARVRNHPVVRAALGAKHLMRRAMRRK